MKRGGSSTEGIPDHDGRGEFRAESLRKAAFPGGSCWWSAIRASERGDVGA